MRWMMMAASLREASHNKALVRAAAARAAALDVEVDLAEFNAFDAPSYDGDRGEDVPPGVVAFKERLATADGLVLSSPEYNYSMPGSFKNFYDWVSTIRPMPWRGLPVQLMCATVSQTGGRQGLQALRVPFDGCGAFVHPPQFILCGTHDAFDADGNLADPALAERLDDTLRPFAAFCSALRRVRS